jgi:SAM-dependent methyltransferase
MTNAMLAENPSNLEVLSQLPPDHGGFDIRDDALMASLSAAEDAHFWHVARNELIATRLAALGVAAGMPFLELGCGGGAVSAHLSRSGLEVTGVDGHLPRVIEAARRAPRARFIVHDLARGVDALPGGFSAAGLFDVIEHLDDPRQALVAALTRVVPGGLVVGTVPALMSLWSDYDARGGHRLRYHRRTLHALLADVPGARLVEICWFNHLLVPAMWLQRRARARPDHGLHVPARLVNQALLGILRLEYWADRHVGTLRSSVPGASLWFALRRDEPR